MTQQSPIKDTSKFPSTTQYTYRSERTKDHTGDTTGPLEILSGRQITSVTNCCAQEATALSAAMAAAAPITAGVQEGWARAATACIAFASA